MKIPAWSSSILQPETVAMVGASRQLTKSGRQLYRQLHHFSGRVVGINLQIRPGRFLEGRPVYQSVSQVPGRVDLALIAVDEISVKDVLVDCAYASVKAAILYTRNSAHDAKLLSIWREVAQRAGIRLIGPDSLGVVVPRIGLDAAMTGMLSRLSAGNIALLSQSAAIGLAALDSVVSNHHGVSLFAHLGDEIDLTAADWLELALADPATEVIGLHMHQWTGSQGSEILQLLHRAKSKKLVVILGSPDDDADLWHDSVIQVGAIPTTSFTDFCSLVSWLARPIQLAQGHLVLLAPDQGTTALTANAAKTAGLSLITVSPSSAEMVRGIRHPFGIDTEHTLYSVAALEQALHQLLHTPADAVVAMLTPSITLRPQLAAKMLAKWAQTSGKQVVAVVMGEKGVESARAALGEYHIPTLDAPDVAMRLLALAYHHHQLRASRQPLSLPSAMARQIKPFLVLENLDAAQCQRLWHVLHVPVIPQSTIHSRLEAEKASKVFGWPVRLVNQKSGEARLHVDSLGQLQQAYHYLSKSPGELVAQPQPHDGVELCLVVRTSSAVGTYMELSALGAFSQWIKPATCVAPCSEGDVYQMVGSLHVSHMLGQENGHAAGVKELRHIVTQIGRLISQFPQFRIELDSIMVTAGHAYVAESRVQFPPIESDD